MRLAESVPADAPDLTLAEALAAAVDQHVVAGPQPWTVYVLVSLVPPLFAGGLLSMGRLTSTLFPLFLALASMPPRAIGLSRPPSGSCKA